MRHLPNDPIIARSMVEVTVGLLLCLLILAVAGCSATHQEREFLIERVTGDIILRDIGSDSSMAVPGEKSLQLDSAFPVQQIPLDLAVSIYKSGIFSGYNVIIRDVSGSLIVDRALVGETNLDLPAALEKIFKPGNPFEKKYD